MLEGELQLIGEAMVGQQLSGREATAILAGDALLTLAFEVLATQVNPAKVAAYCVADLANASGWSGMVGGQMLDLQAESGGVRSAEHLQTIHNAKTGQLIAASVRIGGRIGGADDETLRRLTKYGLNIGLAFQIADDLLDETGDESKAGKQLRKDADSNKLTYPALMGLEASRAEAERLIESACGALDLFGNSAEPLRQIAEFVIHRDH